MVGALPVVHPRWIRLQQLRLFQQLELDVVVEILASYCVRGVGSGRCCEEVLRGLCASYAYSLEVFLEAADGLEDLEELGHSLVFLRLLVIASVVALFVAYLRRSRSA